MYNLLQSIVLSSNGNIFAVFQRIYENSDTSFRLKIKTEHYLRILSSYTSRTDDDASPVSDGKHESGSGLK